MDLSVVIPFLDEEENIPEMGRRVLAVLSGTPYDFEVLLVDDGSTDRSLERMRELQREDPRVRVVKLRRNFGQTPAMKAGIDLARGRVIVTLDGDLQNDPADIPLLVEKLDEGHDLVTGWRRRRKDPFITRKLPSRVANWIIWKITGVRVHDNGCSLKAYRASVIKETPLYSELHRFIPAMVTVAGGRITEVPVNHSPRRRGASKYGLSRIGKVLADMAVVKMLIAFAERPLHWFGLFSLPFALLALAGTALAAAAALWPEVEVTGAVLASLILLGGFLSIHFLTMGILAELVVKTGKPYQFRAMSSAAIGEREEGSSRENDGSRA